MTFKNLHLLRLKIANASIGLIEAELLVASLSKPEKQKTSEQMEIQEYFNITVISKNPVMLVKQVTSELTLKTVNCYGTDLLNNFRIDKGCNYKLETRNKNRIRASSV
jgi:hypothetical protein